MEKTVWSFDLGKASIGEAVRNLDTNEFAHVASLLIPAEFASTKEAEKRRHAWRTLRDIFCRHQFFKATKAGLSSGLCCFKKRLLLQVSTTCAEEELPALLTLS